MKVLLCILTNCIVLCKNYIYRNKKNFYIYVDCGLAIYYNMIMGATKEHRQYDLGERVWVGKYKNSQNTLHWHDDCELIYVECGAVDVYVNGETHALGANRAMFIQSELMHRINAQTADTLLKTIIFDYDTIKAFADGISLRSPVLSNSYDIPETYAELMTELTDQKPFYIQAAESAVVRLMVDILRNESTEPTKQRSKADAKLKALFSEIRKNYADYTLADAARFMNMNQSYLSRFFTERTGMHFMRYVNCVRVENAVDMLRSGEKNVTEAATECGFGTIRNFNRIFKLLTGYSPSALPDGYEFSDSVRRADDGNADPTLFGCELVESSSDKRLRSN